MRSKIFISVFSICSFLFSSSALSAVIEGWGVVGTDLYQISFDSDTANSNSATRTFIHSFDEAIGSMALSSDSGSIYAISSVNSDVFEFNLSSKTTLNLGQVPNGGFDLNGATTRGDEILMIDNGVLPKVWSLDKSDATSSIEQFRTNETTSIGGRASSLVNVDDDTLLFFNDWHNNSSFVRRAWTLDNDGTTTLLGTVVDELMNEVTGFNASEIAADGAVYALDGGRRIWEIDFLGASNGFVKATQVDHFDPDGVGSYGWTSVVFAPATNPVPEPSILALMAAGLAGLGFVRRRKQKT